MSTSPPRDWPERPICGLDELDDPGAKGFYVGDGEWPFRGFVIRKGAEIFAYANICPHRRRPLDMLPDAFLIDDGRMIRCASHGALFSPETGMCLTGPCAGRSLMKLEARIDADQIVRIQAPDSLQEAGQIIDADFSTI